MNTTIPMREVENPDTKQALEHVEQPETGVEKINDIAPDEIQDEVQRLQDPEYVRAEKKYLRKLDWIILPTVSFLYFFEYLDRVVGFSANVANAKLYGFASGHSTDDKGIGPGDKSLPSHQWQIIISIFYVGLILGEIPGAIGYRIFPCGKWIALGVCMWSAITLLQCSTFNFAGEIACRIGIGFFSSLYGSGVVYYLSLWYHRHELASRVFWFLGPTPLAGAFSGLLGFAIGHIHSHIPNWRLIFVIEALPGFVLGLVCLFWLPDRPQKNHRFKGIEAEIALARYRQEAYEKEGGIQKRHVVQLLLDWKLYAQVIIYIPVSAVTAGIGGFLPTIVKDLGYTSTRANLMTVPPYALGFVLMLITARTSDKLRDRGWHCICCMCVSALGYLLLGVLPETALKAKYGVMFLAVGFLYPNYILTHAWAANNWANETMRALGMGTYFALINFGSIGGSYAFPAKDAPQYRPGHLTCFALMIIAALLSAGNHFILRSINRKRDRLYGKPPPGVSIDVSELADKAPHFRYMT